MNNFEKIKNMAIDELVKFILSIDEGICGYCDTCYEDCEFGIKKWLESEAE